MSVFEEVAHVLEDVEGIFRDPDKVRDLQLAMADLEYEESGDMESDAMLMEADLARVKGE